jgi:hypothetical protein
MDSWDKEVQPTQVCLGEINEFSVVRLSPSVPSFKSFFQDRNVP